VFDDYPGTNSDTAFGFDAAGNMTSSVNAIAAWTYTYNKRGLLESEVVNIDGRWYGFDPNYNNLAQPASLTYPDSYLVNFAPNAFGEPTQVNGTCCGNGTPIGLLASNIQYHASGQVQSYTLGNGLTYTQGLDARLRPNLQETKSGGTSIQKLLYGYSNAGDLTAIVDQVDGADSSTLTYDNLHRLKTASGLWGNYTYGYDPINNIRSRSGGAGTLGYSYDAGSNRLTSVSGTAIAPPPSGSLPADPAPGAAPAAPYIAPAGNPSAPVQPPPYVPPPAAPPSNKPPEPVDPCFGVQCTPPPESSSLRTTAPKTLVRTQSVTGTRNFGYDARGRINVDGNRGYAWNDADQIITVPGIARYAYDGNGKRIRTLKANGELEYALYSLSGTLFYVDRPGRNHSIYPQIGGKTIAEVTDWVPTYVHPDLLGSPRLATNGSQQQLWREHYGPYGEKLNSVGTKTGYTGHAYDGETGLTYAQARFYDPVIGRFLSIDPIGFTDSPFTFNRYSYGNNTPYVYIDPTGTTIQKPNPIIPNLSSRVGGSTSAGSYIGSRGAGDFYSALPNFSDADGSNQNSEQEKPAQQAIQMADASSEIKDSLINPTPVR